MGFQYIVGRQEHSQSQTETTDTGESCDEASTKSRSCKNDRRILQGNLFSHNKKKKKLIPSIAVVTTEVLIIQQQKCHPIDCEVNAFFRDSNSACSTQHMFSKHTHTQQSQSNIVPVSMYIILA